MYLFIVYFSFASIISASIHCYVNYFDIQVLMMVTETEMLTSTLHHNIFTYLDYVFFCYLHIVGFYPYLLSYLGRREHVYISMHAYGGRVCISMCGQAYLFRYVWAEVACSTQQNSSCMVRYFPSHITH